MKNWLQLFRLPNLFTIPGDILAGYLICLAPLSETSLYLAICASLCFYIFGLIANDIADIKIDRIERPERPLASRKITVKIAVIVALILLISGFICSRLANQKTFAVSVSLATLIIFYNFFMPRKTMFYGPLLLALCRLLNIMLGVTASGTFLSRQLVFIGYSMTEFFYVLFVSMAASFEVKSEKPKLFPFIGIGIICSFLPLIICAVLDLLRIYPYTGEIPPVFLIGFFLILIAGFAVFIKGIAWLITPQDANFAKDIGFLLRNIIFIQATACAFSGNMNATFIVALLAFPAYLLSRHFYGS